MFVSPSRKLLGLLAVLKHAAAVLETIPLFRKLPQGIEPDQHGWVQNIKENPLLV